MVKSNVVITNEVKNKDTDYLILNQWTQVVTSQKTTCCLP